jgi:hypothetical protein
MCIANSTGPASACCENLSLVRKTQKFCSESHVTWAVWGISWLNLHSVNGAIPCELTRNIEKVLSTPSFGGEVKLSVPCRRFVACKRTLRFTWNSESQAKLSGHFSPYFCPSLTEVSHVAWHGVPLEMTDGTDWRCTNGPYLRSRCIRGGIPETATSIYL